jgi:hypothetical protein
MCTLYSLTKSQKAIRELAKAMMDRTGNMPSLWCLTTHHDWQFASRDKLALATRTSNLGSASLFVAALAADPPI